MDGMLKVTPDTLRACAGHVTAAGKKTNELSGRAADDCAKAADPHAAWEFGGALTALAPLWRRELAKRGAAVTASAEKLADTADTYAAAEARNADLARAAVTGSRATAA